MGLYRELDAILASGREAAMVTVLSEAGLVSKTLRPLAAESHQELFESLGLGLPPEGSLVAVRGDQKVIVERLFPAPRLVVFGGGHIAQALAPMAAALRLDTVIYDDRPFFANKALFKTASDVICDAFDSISLAIRPADLVVIATRGHKHDEDCLAHVLAGPEPLYAGMIGSRRRVAIVRKLLEDKGVDKERLSRLRSPIGLPIGAVTPAEIAVSILAEIIQVSREAKKDLGLGGLEASADLGLIAFLAGREAEKDPVAAVALTVVSTKGSTPRKAGAKMAAMLDGRVVGSIGGGCAEGGLIAEARKPGLVAQITRVDMTDQAEEDGMVCGGLMEVLMEPL
ncbi:MAG: XdhC family protein [Deltaproteobacteria bacterium]|jgi:xanthine dehydrogenase accessory factor|nr:XdhC family protein [Deltaproteobacteria bacterium]